jgi:hypothetical protein
LSAGSAATPVAMCGFSCRSNGRYIPGPPSAASPEDSTNCGSSGGYGPVGGTPPLRSLVGAFTGGPYFARGANQ